MKALIVTGGTPPSRCLLEEELGQKPELVIAADSGARVLLKEGIAFDLAVGDFDSLEEELLERIKAERAVVVYPQEKDFSDTEAALREAARRGAGEVVILGATGSRIDHLLANLSLLILSVDLAMKTTIRDEHNEVFLLTESGGIEPRPGRYLSFFPVGGDVPGFTLENVRYPLSGHLLQQGSSLTVSNEFLDGPARVSFPQGQVLAVISQD